MAVPNRAQRAVHVLLWRAHSHTHHDSQRTDEIGYQIPANWSLQNRTPYALNFSREVQALTPKVRVTPVIAMGGSYATANFHAAEDFTKAMMAEAIRWGWDGYTMETEIKYTEHDAIDMARFLDTFAGALHTVNKTLAVITKSTFRCVCVHVCARVCVSLCVVFVHVCECARVCVCARACACVHAHVLCFVCM